MLENILLLYKSENILLRAFVKQEDDLKIWYRISVKFYLKEKDAIAIAIGH